jgi:hypothetical protein
MTASVIRGAIGAIIKGPYIAPWKKARVFNIDQAY